MQASPQFVTSLAVLLLADCNVDVNAENIDAVVASSNNKIAPYYATLYSSCVEKAGGVDKFFQSPGGGGGGAGKNFFNILFFSVFSFDQLLIQLYQKYNIYTYIFDIIYFF
jgi:hypothetical protein